MLATSAGLPALPIGILLIMVSHTFSGTPRVMSVSIKPGQMALQVTPFLARAVYKRQAPFYVNHLPDFAVVVAVTPEHKVILVRQYRHGVEKVLLELPAGCIEQIGRAHV